MKTPAPTPALPAGALVAWSTVAPATAHLWIVVVKNQTNDLMSFCYTIPEMASGCFGSTDVPPNSTAIVNTGRACAGRWRVSRAPDGHVQTLSRLRGGACGDGRLSIRPNFPGVRLGGP